MSERQPDAWRWRRRITAGKPNPWVYHDEVGSPAYYLSHPGVFEVEFLQVAPVDKPTHYDIRVDTYSDEITRLPAHRVTPVVLPPSTSHAGGAAVKIQFTWDGLAATVYATSEECDKAFDAIVSKFPEIKLHLRPDTFSGGHRLQYFVAGFLPSYVITTEEASKIPLACPS